MAAVGNFYLALSLVAVTKGTSALDEQKLVQWNIFKINTYCVHILMFELKNINTSTVQTVESYLQQTEGTQNLQLRNMFCAENKMTTKHLHNSHVNRNPCSIKLALSMSFTRNSLLDLYSPLIAEAPGPACSSFKHHNSYHKFVFVTINRVAQVD
jgi:hypothetical protein